MSDPALLQHGMVWLETAPGIQEFVQVVRVSVVAKTKDGVVHQVKYVTVDSSWARGQWRMLVLCCGQSMKHHPKKLDRSVGSTTADRAVTCLGCVSNRGAT